jgi:hypothetical protein
MMNVVDDHLVRKKEILMPALDVLPNRTKRV